MYLPSFKLLVSVLPRDIDILPSNALEKPTVNSVVIPSVAPTATLFEIAADPVYPVKLNAAFDVSKGCIA